MVCCNGLLVHFATGARGTELPPPPHLFKFLFTYLFSIKFLYFFIISSLIPYVNLFVSIFIQSYVNSKLRVSTQKYLKLRKGGGGSFVPRAPVHFVCKMLFDSNCDIRYCTWMLGVISITYLLFPEDCTLKLKVKKLTKWNFLAQYSKSSVRYRLLGY